MESCAGSKRQPRDAFGAIQVKVGLDVKGVVSRLSSDGSRDLILNSRYFARCDVAVQQGLLEKTQWMIHDAGDVDRAERSGRDAVVDRNVSLRSRTEDCGESPARSRSRLVGDLFRAL